MFIWLNLKCSITKLKPKKLELRRRNLQHVMSEGQGNMSSQIMEVETSATFCTLVSHPPRGGGGGVVLNIVL